MLNFDFTEEQILIRDTARAFAETEIAPTTIERDVNAIFPTEIVRKLGELGFMGMMVSTDDGGSDMDTVSYALAVEEISKVDASVGVIMSVNNSLVCWALSEFGTAEQKKRLLTPLAKGTKIGAFCLSEPEAGSDATQQQTTAERTAEGWVINGMKNWITNGTTSDIYLVLAQTDRPKRHKGITAFLVEWGADGFTRGKKEDKLGIRSSDTCSLAFTNVFVPDSNRLGEVGDGFHIAMQTLNGGRIGIAAQAVGIATGAMNAAIAYAKERKAFGKPISNLQAIQFKLSDMAVKTDGARLLTLQAARLKDEGKPFIKEAAMAKLFASQAAVDVALDAIQVHGAYGYVREYQVERYLRDAKVTQIYEGTSEVQHVIIARELLRT